MNEVSSTWKVTWMDDTLQSDGYTLASEQHTMTVSSIEELHHLLYMLYERKVVEETIVVTRYVVTGHVYGTLVKDIFNRFRVKGA